MQVQVSELSCPELNGASNIMMKRIFVLLLLSLSFMGFNSSIFAAEKAIECAEDDQACLEKQNKEKQKKKKDAATDEEPDCD